MKVVFWLPMLVVNQVVALLPRAIFIKQYKKSSLQYAAVENDARNKLRLAAYKLKKIQHHR